MRMAGMVGGICLGCAMLAVCTVVDAAEKATAEEAEQAATEWLDGLGDMGLTLDEQITEGSFVGQVSGTDHDHSIAILSHDGWSITLGFSGPITADMPLETVQERLSSVAMFRLPTPGLEVEGWDFQPKIRTYFIHDKEAIAITSFEDGKITLHVETEFFALYGRDPSMSNPGDAIMRPGSYFQILRAFPLQLTVEAPFTPQ